MSICTETLEQFKHFLSEKSLFNTNEKWGILTDSTSAQIIQTIAKSNGISCIVLPTDEISNLKNEICNHQINTLFISSQWIQAANLLQWECPSFHTYVCIGVENPHSLEEIQPNQLMNPSLWDIINRRAKNNISAGGWFSSYTGKPFSQQEMDEYIFNIKQKLLPHLSKTMDILEIGCASGLTMYELSPFVRTYTGIDMSKKMIEQNRLFIKKQELTNIRVLCLKADEIDQLSPQKFNVLVMNSVSQYFHGFNYLRDVLKKMISLVPETGVLFIGDVMDLKQKENLINSIKKFQKNTSEIQYRNNTQFENELFIPREFFDDFQIECGEVIEDVLISDKIGSISNELRNFRYDVILKVNKSKRKIKVNHSKQKKQYGYTFKSL
ncbi:class I SAM-dependent methyltransferase [Bacillus cereus group sp. N21]|uniref:class I SAM-dependent methyltransferase n=1 Tax=Bacillus cereus group sp. N21 TaxID=2794591 RepID=UPI0018F6314C|nr:class I SAM-dependent methyltransferase [Bacillus cereus group sp. N21]MBJ8030398.1 class I SAM-dependent methyltransferase [Bacillus cereus group sp. N21]